MQEEQRICEHGNMFERNLDWQQHRYKWRQQNDLSKRDTPLMEVLEILVWTGSEIHW